MNECSAGRFDLPMLIAPFLLLVYSILKLFTSFAKMISMLILPQPSLLFSLSAEYLSKYSRAVLLVL